VSVFGFDEAFFEEASEFFVDFFFGLADFFGDFIQRQGFVGVFQSCDDDFFEFSHCYPLICCVLR
jgi:hypothetical protein